jgi:trans-2,3-dihydro-3-hydroxyanthranilate isomerase
VRLPFRLVDVFTDRPLAGNQLCVISSPGDLSSEVMQAVALEIGFSETTFVTGVYGDRYEMRIFTPAEELPFAGHPSLGTAFVLAREGRIRSVVTQKVIAGEIRLEIDLGAGFVRMRQLTPLFQQPFDDLDWVAEAAGVERADLHPVLPPQVVSTGLAHLLVPAKRAEAVRWARPDPRSLGDLLSRVGASGLYLFSVEEGEVHARCFAPGVGVPEDAGTGSASGPLGAYLVDREVVPPGRITVTQGMEMGRPSLLQVDVDRTGEDWSIFVGGNVVAVGEGVFDLPS